MKIRLRILKKKWNGFHQEFFKINGRRGYIVFPKNPKNGNPWIWRARFPGYHYKMDISLVKSGFHIAHIDTEGLHGGVDSIKLWDEAYLVFKNTYNLSKNVCLEGVSRGALTMYAWAKQNAEKINCIYADTPVCDIKSWPLGQGTGKGSKVDWDLILKEYGLTHEEALLFDDNPIDNLEPLVKNNIPIMHLVGLNDTVVPPSENTFIFKKNYKKLGGKITVLENRFVKEECEGHHFNIDEPRKIVEFFKKNEPCYPKNQ